MSIYLFPPNVVLFHAVWSFIWNKQTNLKTVALWKLPRGWRFSENSTVLFACMRTNRCFRGRPLRLTSSPMCDSYSCNLITLATADKWQTSRVRYHFIVMLPSCSEPYLLWPFSLFVRLLIGQCALWELRSPPDRLHVWLLVNHFKIPLVCMKKMYYVKAHCVIPVGKCWRKHLGQSFNPHFWITTKYILKDETNVFVKKYPRTFGTRPKFTNLPGQNGSLPVNEHVDYVRSVERSLHCLCF